jgi:glycosyltransferase involved in cell wall biosynthesis
MPFFSIIIPTRNRPDLFKDALQSVLLQDFDDYEVIVSDNSTDNNTQIAIEPFCNHPKLTVFRTDGHLSMPKHWEFATQKAQGRYVMVVTDRSVLKQHSLATIYSAISSSEQEVLVCSWRWSLFDDTYSCEYADFPMIKDKKNIVLSSYRVAQNFVNGQKGYPYDLPRGMNSCYLSDLAAEIRKQYGALFLPISPDFTSAFLLLAHTKQILFLDTALFISQGLNISNGGKCLNSITSAESYIKMLGISDYCPHVPIKIIGMAESAIFEDFLAMQVLAGGELNKVEMNWIEYFVRCYRELINKRIQNIMNEQDISTLQIAWQRSLENTTQDIQQQVNKQVGKLSLSKINIIIKNIPLGNKLITFYRYLRRLSYFAGKIQNLPVLKVAGFYENTSS